MNILEKIIASKKREVEKKKREISINDLKARYGYNQPCFSLSANLEKPDLTGIIAEFKRKSPSKGIINNRNTPLEVAQAYADCGASGISVLTDFEFFGGELTDLESVSAIKIPFLRKDFIIDQYQVHEAKAYGASVILLIAACLSKIEVKDLASEAVQLGMEVLLEIHDETELDHICEETRLIGVNNRNLKSFEVSLETSQNLIHKIPHHKTAITESGLNSVDDIIMLKKAGYKGFLIGEYFMKQTDPMMAFKAFSSKLKLANEN